jgi:hypothetical protein
LRLKSERLDEIIWRIFSEDFHKVAQPIHVADALLAADVLEPEEIHNFTRRAVTERVRTVLRQHDAYGLPLAGPVASEEDDSGQPTLWKARSDWTREDYWHNIKQRRGSLKADYRVLYLMHAECKFRYGDAPEIPELVGGKNGDDDEAE